MLTARRPVGVGSRVLWAKCRPVSIWARVVVSHVEDPDKVRSRLLRRINELLSPVGNWPFGKTLRASDVYEAILSEPGVRYAERLNLTIEDGPTAGINDIVRDPRQPRISYAATDSGLFRSLDSAESWTKIHAAQGERMMALRCHPEVPGLLAAIAQGDSAIWPIYISSDGGESWKLLEQVQGEQVYDAAWMRRDERPILLLATRRSLRRIELGDEAGSKGVDRIGKDEAAQDTGREGFYAVAAARHPRGVRFVALAAREKRGVLLSLDGGAPGTFELLRGAEGKDIRGLVFHRDGDRMFLWAAILAEAGAEGEGVMRIEARADGIDPAGWKMFSKGWKGGSCEGLDMLGTFVVAGSNRAGALVLDSSVPDPGWTAPSLDCGLPITDDRKSLAPVPTIAAIPGEGGNAVILAGTRTGLFASSDGGKRFTNAGQTVFSDRAPLPPNWLYCSGKHDITVVRDSAEAEG